MENPFDFIGKFSRELEVRVVFRIPVRTMDPTIRVDFNGRVRPEVRADTGDIPKIIRWIVRVMLNG